MKVLHVVSSLSVVSGGVSAGVRDLCLGLSDAGVKVELLTTLRGYDPYREGPLDEPLKTAGVEPLYFPAHPWGWLGGAHAYSPELRRELRKRIPAVDLAHLHGVWLYPTDTAARICRAFGIPYIVSPHGALDRYGLRRHPLLKRIYGLTLERQVLAGASLIHFTSRAEQRQAWTFGVDRPTTVIPLSIDVQAAVSVPPGSFRARFPEATEKHLLLFLGRLHAKKGLDFLVDVFVRVAQHRNDVRLVVAGPEGGAGPAARRALAQAGLLERATFTGLLLGKDKWSAFRDSRLFLLPSEDENFGVSVLEAMAAGVPVLVSQQVGLADAVAGGRTGLVLKRSPAVWAESVERLLDDPPSCLRMAEAGRQLAQTEYSTNRIAARMREAYASVLRHD
ncbi:MAG: glycosyltransferase [Candidatus Omnitrophota bacterium]|nr:glycosyltransferase [Candidatus Omnitrophota bacterium]